MTAPESFAGNTQGDPGWEVYMHTADAGLEVRVPVKAGTRDVSVSFVRQYWEPEGVLQPPQRGFARTTNELYFGEPAVDRVLVGGPYRRAGRNDTPSRRRIFRLPAAPPARLTKPCAQEDSLDARAPRLPPSGHGGRGATLLEFYGPGAPKADSKPASSAGSVASFLRRASCSASNASLPTSPPATPYRIDAIDLASRLSFFLWSSIPDDELLDLGIRGTLTNPAVLERQVRRMLRDPRSQALVDNFANQWLKLGRLSGVVPDVDEFPDFDENLRDALQQETELFIGSQLREDRSVVDLVARELHVRQRTAGAPLPDSERVRQSLPPRHVRGRDSGRASRSGQHPDGDVVSQPDVAVAARPLAAREHARRAAAGAAARRAGAEGKRRGAASAASVRERLEAHRKNPGCAACHVRMDPLGFSLENFDALGKWRT